MLVGMQTFCASCPQCQKLSRSCFIYWYRCKSQRSLSCCGSTFNEIVESFYAHCSETVTDRPVKEGSVNTNLLLYTLSFSYIHKMGINVPYRHAIKQIYEYFGITMISSPEKRELMLLLKYNESCILLWHRHEPHYENSRKS